ncbi:MAG: glycosyltransferase family 1 protein [Bacteroidota bacterium]
MKIGFDAKRAFMNASGLGNYSRTLIQSLMENFPEHKYVAFTPKIEDGLGSDLTSTGKLRIIVPPQIMRGFLSSWWRSSMVSEDIRAQNLDVFHGLSNELPKRIPVSTMKVVTVHDLIFLRHPEWYPLFDRNNYYKKFRNACKQADVVVAVSEQTKKDIQYYFNTDEKKIKVVYQSCNRQFLSRGSDATLLEFRNKNNLPERYILYVGTIEERKNLLTLLQALTKIDVSLVVIGRKKSYFEKVNAFINANNLQSRILFPGKTGKEELPLYFQCASAFVYPSRYEGFGIPVIEALSSGTPVITSSTTALPEAGGPSSLYFNPDDVDGLVEKIKSVLDDGELRKKIVGDGLEYVKRFDPAETSAQMMEIYKGSSK